MCACAREEKKESKMPSALRRPRHRGLYIRRLTYPHPTHLPMHIQDAMLFNSGMEIEDGISSAEAELTTDSHLDDITKPSQLDATSHAEARQRA